MPNRTDTRCRDTFIAAIRKAEPMLDLSYDECCEPGSERFVTWEWRSDRLDLAWFAFCAAYKPPSDVDPETVLGKLTSIRDRHGESAVLIAINGATLPEIIEVIETLQKTAKETP